MHETELMKGFKNDINIELLNKEPKKLNNIYYEREKEKKEKEKDIIESNYRTEYNNNNQEDI